MLLSKLFVAGKVICKANKCSLPLDYEPYPHIEYVVYDTKNGRQEDIFNIENDTNSYQFFSLGTYI